MELSSTLMLLIPLILCGLAGLVFLVILATSIKIVPESKRLSVFRLGQFIGEKGPGLVVLMPFIDRAITSEPGHPIKTL